MSGFAYDQRGRARRAARPRAGDAPVPHELLRLQAASGNRAVQRLLAVQRVRPEDKGSTASVDRLLEGALEQDTVQAAVRRIYENTFTAPGWSYSASATSRGQDLCQGTARQGHCQQFSDAFQYLLGVYGERRAAHRLPEVARGQLEVTQVTDLGGRNFVTRTGLTLRGGLRGNVYLRVDSTGAPLVEGIDAINQFVFHGHWTTRVNGVDYDPIFHTVDQDNVGRLLDVYYRHGDEIYLVDRSRPTPGGEFAATFVHLVGYGDFRATVDTAIALYQAHAPRVDALVAESVVKRMWRKLRGRVPAEAAEAGRVFAAVTDHAAFARLVGMAYQSDLLSGQERDRCLKVLRLARLYR